MKIGLIDVDNFCKKAKYPNLALMKISAWHKRRGDTVEWWIGYGEYDRVYMSKVFDETYTQDIDEPYNAKEVIKGGTGYGLDNELPDEIEHIYPDYSLYPELTKNTAYGFLTRGCPRGCSFCIVSGKEGRKSRKVADLSEWWSGQKNIVLMDPNLLACTEHMDLLGQLAQSGSFVDVNQGFDCRLLTEENINAINRIKLKNIHFAWDFMREEERVVRGLDVYRALAKTKPHGSYGTVYMLTGYDTSIEEDLHRISTIRSLGYDPYVMIYDKPNSKKELKDLQRWCNNRKIFKKCPDFKKYNPGKMGTEA